VLATKERGGRAACAFSAPFGLRQQPPPCPVTPTHAGSHRSSPSAATARTHRNTHSKRRVAQRAPSVCRPAGGAFLLKQQGLLFCIISPIPSLCGHRQQQQRCCPTTVPRTAVVVSTVVVGVAKSCNTAAAVLQLFQLQRRNPLLTRSRSRSRSRLRSDHEREDGSSRCESTKPGKDL